MEGLKFHLVLICLKLGIMIEEKLSLRWQIMTIMQCFVSRHQKRDRREATKNRVN